MKRIMKYALLLICALAAGFLLQVVAAFAVVLPAMIIKQIQLISMGVNDAAQAAEILNEYSMSLMGLTVLVTHIVMLVVFALWYIFGCCRKREVIQPLKRTFTKRNLLVIVILSVSCCYLTNFFMPIASLFIPENIMQAYMELMETAGFGESILPTIAAVLVAPFGEELIFRGVCYHYAGKMTEGMKNRRIAFYIANTLQALAFGIFHGNLIQGTYAFFMGLMLGYLRERFGSIWASILGHMLINGISSFLWAPLFKVLPETMFVFMTGSVICTVIMIMGFKMGKRAVAEQNISDNFYENETFR